MNILVVESQELLMDLIKGALEACGHKVTKASHGSHAIDLIIDGEYDLVVSAYTLSHFGFDWWRSVEAHRKVFGQKVLCLAYEPSKVPLKLYDRILPKPVNIFNFANTVRSLEG